MHAGPSGETWILVDHSREEAIARLFSSAANARKWLRDVYLGPSADLLVWELRDGVPDHYQARDLEAGLTHTLTLFKEQVDAELQRA